jgi:hypothetical protein
VTTVATKDQSAEPRPIFAVRGTDGTGFCVAYDEDDKTWCVHRMPGKELIKRYISLPKAFSRIGSELEQRLGKRKDENAKR